MLPTRPIPDWIIERYPRLKLINFKAPKDVPEEEVGELPTLAGSWEGGVFDGGPHMRTYWQPREEEIEALKNGAVIELTIWGENMPPLALNVEVE